MSYTIEQVISALRIFNSRNESEETKFEPYQMLDWHIKQLESPWIKTSERLPEERMRVLAWNGLIIDDCYYGHGGLGREQVCWRFTHTDNACRHEITHWMPLPSSPNTL